eukprot:1499585-Lingulodinium_polyedra.AAC.1
MKVNKLSPAGGACACYCCNRRRCPRCLYNSERGPWLSSGHRRGTGQTPRPTTTTAFRAMAHGADANALAAMP